MFFRNVLVNGFIIILVIFWSIPIAAVVSLLSLESLRKVFPWLEGLAKKNEFLKAFIQGSLPTLVVATLNAILPIILQSKFIKLLY